MDEITSEAAIQHLLAAQGIVVIIGAGVSVAAGIPAFRGIGGIHSQKMNGMTIEDLMNIKAIRNPDMLTEHCKLIASMAKKAVLAEPTPFHRLLQLLDRKKKIKRIYTQNIDGLESKAGFDPVIGTESRCIPLHGSLLQLRCPLCSAKRPLELYFHKLEVGKLPPCDSCEATRIERISKKKRPRASGLLRPDIVLYEENIESGEMIMEMATADARDVSKGDVLFVVGTSLKIPGVIEIIRTVGAAVNEVEGHVIYLDLKAPQSMTKYKFSDYVQGDCQVFAQSTIDILNATEKPDVHTYIKKVEERLDMRPLWDWV